LEEEEEEEVGSGEGRIERTRGLAEFRGGA
jgi:hypothetical protein